MRIRLVHFSVQDFGSALRAFEAARAAIADLIPQWKKDWSVTVEPFGAVQARSPSRRPR